ncbi:Flagellin [Planctomycetes bacterium Pan216]|uniref:Flagellin n=1 Tax=Kolteria novifilia TaxID=2527975 RepID=A0A518B233_9BACT|nr:Flagellin [Planctomycetes bacterium Pan216]
MSQLSINTNVPSVVSQFNLQRNSDKLNNTLESISTGLRIRSAKDGPADLISGETLRLELTSINSAIQNNQRANNFAATAEASLREIGSLLDEIEGILVNSANEGVLSQEELEANQASVDQAVLSINRIASSTRFANRSVLDGSFGFELSGVNRFDQAGTLSDVNVRLANFNSSGDAISVDVNLTATASQATVTLNNGGTASVDSTIEIIGNSGAVTLNIGAGQSVDDAVNAFTDATGVSSSNGILTSVEFGSNAFVNVNNVVGALLTNSEASAVGTNVEGTINGQEFEGDGLRATLATTNLQLELSFQESVTTTGDVGSFSIESGGALFQLGAEINLAQQVNIGLESFLASSLGSVSVDEDGNALNRTLSSIVTGGENSILAGSASIAQDIVAESQRQVTTTQGFLGSIQRNTIETNLNSLSVAFENITAARSTIVDVNFAQATAELTQQQILLQANVSTAAIANSNPQTLLQLLG